VRDAIVLGMLVLGFATFVTTHLTLVIVLFFRERPRWRGLAALAVPPLGPIWAWQTGHKKKVVLWLVAVAVYTVGVIVASLT
jgi:hypothetical protein